MTNENMRKKRYMQTIACLLATTIMMIAEATAAMIPDLHFRRLDTRDGLSSSQVNCIFRDSKGYVWMATNYGLNRYDGYRIRHFYSYDKDSTTIPSNRVDKVEEASDGRLWMKHDMSYSVYDPVTERVDRNPSLWLNKLGVHGSIEHLHIDSKKNYWIKTIDDGFAYLNPQSKKVTHINFGYGPKEFSKEFGITDYAESKRGMLVISSQAELMCIDGENGEILWKNDYVKNILDQYNDYGLYVDKNDNYWVITRQNTLFTYIQKERKWYNNLPDLMRAYGFSNVPDEIIVWDVHYDTKGLLWVSTDHMGVLVLDFKNREWRQFTNVKGDETSLPDITTRRFCLDQLGRMWVATYKNGVAMCLEAMSNFSSHAVGDINAVCEDKAGYYWLGCNNGGILRLDSRTMEVVERHTKESLGLRSDIIVSAFTAQDGSVWFGTYEGGLIKYHNGHWHNYLASDPGSALTTNNIWSVTQDKWGHMWIGILGGGVARIDGKTGKQRVFNSDNSDLASIWTNSVQRGKNGWIIVGNSEYYSMINPGNFKIENGGVQQDGNTYTISSGTNHAYMDTRGLVWLGSASGVSICDRKNNTTTLLDMKSGLLGSNVVSITEDTKRTMWVVTDHGVSNIVPQRQEDGHWSFTLRSFNDRDGLQPGPFNQRAIWCTHDGKLLIGGQDGLDIINTLKIKNDAGNERPVFSGLLVFDQEVNVGQKVNGHVILDEPLDVSHKLRLRYSENQFTIQMASDNGGLNNGTRFIYQLKGFNDQWVKTTALNPNISYTSLPTGSYTLCVRMLNDDGTMGKVESQLDIVIAAPWYRSWWAIAIYVMLIIAAWYYRKDLITESDKLRSRLKELIEQKRQAAKDKKSKTEEEPVAENADNDIEEAVIIEEDSDL